MAFRQVSKSTIALVAALAMAAGSIGYAQMEGNRGAAPIDDSGTFEVGGVTVDTTGKTAEDARMAGWRMAQRKGWQMLSQRLGGGGGGLNDSALDSLVSGIVVENEQIGPTRYVARLGVLFDRSRAASILGVGGLSTRSPPMLVMPLQISGGTTTVFETRTPWQQAWARFRTGESPIDYIRPSGIGSDPLIFNAGQVLRPSRGWWRGILDQYGAKDLLIPEVQLYRQWPGGPVIGVFTARYGPDNRMIRKFVLRVANSAALPALLDAGVKRMDQIYSDALSAGILRPDIGLIGPPPEVTEDPTEEDAVVLETDNSAALSGAGASIMVQYDTPSGSALTATEGLIRGVPGVRAAATTSMAIGGVSVMRVLFDGDANELKAALQARGWTVEDAGGALRIRRIVAPATPATTPAPSPTPTPAPTG